jgi:predicted phage tail protein
MISSQRRGLTYAVFKGKKNIGIDDLGFPVTGEVIRIVPVVMGSKRGGFFKLFSALFCCVGAIAYAYGGGALVAGGAGNDGGVVQMLSPQPTGLASKQDADNKASYAFGSVTNTAAQGYPVPWVWKAPYRRCNYFGRNLR